MQRQHKTTISIKLPGVKKPVVLSILVSYTFFPAFDNTMEKRVRIESIRLYGFIREIEIIGNLSTDQLVEMEQHILSLLEDKGY